MESSDYSEKYFYLHSCLVAQLCPNFAWTVILQAPLFISTLFIGFSGQEYWVAIPFSGDLPHPRTELGSPALQADTLPSELPGKQFNLH